MLSVPSEHGEIFSVLKRVLPLVTTLLFTLNYSVGDSYALSQPSQLEGIGQGIRDSAAGFAKNIVRAGIDIVSAVATPLAMIGTMMYFSGFLKHEGKGIMIASIASLFLAQAFLPMI